MHVVIKHDSQLVNLWVLQLDDLALLNLVLLLLLQD